MKSIDAGTNRAPVAGCKKNGFTLIELLVVIAIIAVLAGTLVPAFARPKQKDQGIECMNNTRQIMLAWRLYADDNSDYLPPNDYPYQHQYNFGDQGWVVGGMDAGSGTDPTNTIIQNDEKASLLAHYGLRAPVYKCPTDLSQIPSGTSRVRSLSMNQAVGTEFYGGNGGHNPVNGGWLPGTYIGSQTTWRTYGKFSSITQPGPSMLWVLIDEHPDAINDCGLSVECGLTGPNALTIDFPASNHNGGGDVSFADGHSEIHKWQDSRTKPAPTYAFPSSMVLGVPSPNNPDLAWLQQRTSALR